MPKMPERVTITTGARLHFGPLAVRSEHGPDFGGLGLMVDRPGWVVTMDCAVQDEVRGGAESERIARIVSDFRSRSRRVAGPVRIEVRQYIEPHAGFGSGTQLALAIARGLGALHQEPFNVAELAQRTGRGKRSAIGIYGFEQGGLIVDAGHRTQDGIGDLACRLAVPDDWRFVLVTPPSQGLSGGRELTAFERLPPMTLGMTGRLCRLILCDVLPALQQADFARFAAAVTEYGSLVGSYFAPVQGGVFSVPGLSAFVDSISTRFGIGCAQSSWGPTIAMICQDQAKADAVAQAVRADVRWCDCTIRVAAALNRGATCDVLCTESNVVRGAG